MHQHLGFLVSGAQSILIVTYSREHALPKPTLTNSAQPRLQSCHTTLYPTLPHRTTSGHTKSHHLADALIILSA